MGIMVYSFFWAMQDLYHQSSTVGLLSGLPMVWLVVPFFGVFANKNYKGAQRYCKGCYKEPIGTI